MGGEVDRGSLDNFVEIEYLRKSYRKFSHKPKNDQL
jgi:hypothetical protein